MKIGIIDADLLDSNTKFPNLALMKISSWRKALNDDVELTDWNNYNQYDHVYISKVFDHSYSPEIIKHQENITYGGTGFFFDKAPALQYEIEHTKPDYDLYSSVINDNAHKYYHNASIGFTTRGCFRHCGFCVNRNLNHVEKWSDVSEFYDPSKKVITLLDDNILGYAKRNDIINELIDYNKPFEYKQGMDIRLINDDIAELFTHARYHGDYTFAFDDYCNKDIIVPKIELWQKYHGETKKNTKLYLLTAYKSTDANDIKELFERIKIIMHLRCLPYVMRFKTYNNSKYRGMYINLSRWCNQPSLFKKMSFKEFIDKHDDKSATVVYYNEFKQCHNDILSAFENLKYGEC